MGAFVGIFHVLGIATDTIPPKPTNVILSSGGRVEMGLAPIQGFATLKWEYPGFPHLSHFEVAVVEDGKTVEEVPAIIVARGITYKKTLWDVPRFDEVRFDGNVTGISIHSLKPNTVYRCAVRAVSIYNSLRSPWVWSNAVKTGSERVPGISNVVAESRYKGIYLTWNNNGYVESVDISYGPSGKKFSHFIKKYKGNEIFISINLDNDTEDELYDVEITPYNFEGTAGSAVTIQDIDVLSLDSADTDYSDKRNRVDKVIQEDASGIKSGTRLGDKYQLNGSTGILETVPQSGQDPLPILDESGRVITDVVDKDGNIIIDHTNRRIGGNSSSPVIGQKSIVGGRIATGPFAVAQNNYSIGKNPQIDVDDTANFPDSGTAYFSGGYFTYTSKNETSFLDCDVYDSNIAAGMGIVLNEVVVLEGRSVTAYDTKGNVKFVLRDVFRGYNVGGDEKMYIEPGNDLFVFGGGFIDDSDVLIIDKLFVRIVTSSTTITIDKNTGKIYSADTSDLLFDSNIVPYTDATHNLGDDDHHFNKIYIKDLIKASSGLVLQTESGDISFSPESGFVVPEIATSIGESTNKFNAGHFYELHSENLVRIIYGDVNREERDSSSASFDFTEYESLGLTFRDKVIGTFIKRRGDKQLVLYAYIKSYSEGFEIQAKIGYRSIGGTSTTYGTVVTAESENYQFITATVDISYLTNDTPYYFVVSLRGGQDESSNDILGYLKQPLIAVKS